MLPGCALNLPSFGCVCAGFSASYKLPIVSCARNCGRRGFAMVRWATSVRGSAVLATAAIVVAASHPVGSARAVELRDVSGWWIAIDDTFPKHWKSGAIAPMEEVLQINPDGRVSDRVMNFWAGSHQACLENKVCSDLPQITNARLKVSANRWSFISVVPTNARLDTPTGDTL